MTTQTTSHKATSQMTDTQAGSVSTASVKATCAAVFLFGAALVFVVGFAHSSVLHNVAHDTRHSLAFPCH